MVGCAPQEYRAFNPISKMPSLDVDGRCIAESEVICEYLEEVYPDPPMLPADPILRAHSRMVSRINDLYIAPHNNGLVQQQQADPRDQQLIDTAAAEFEKGFRYVAHFMGPGPFAAGDRPSIGDCALTPFIIMLKHTVLPFFRGQSRIQLTEKGGWQPGGRLSRRTPAVAKPLTKSIWD